MHENDKNGAPPMNHAQYQDSDDYPLGSRYLTDIHVNKI